MCINKEWRASLDSRFACIQMETISCRRVKNNMNNHSCNSNKWIQIVLSTACICSFPYTYHLNQDEWKRHLIHFWFRDPFTASHLQFVLAYQLHPWASLLKKKKKTTGCNWFKYCFFFHIDLGCFSLPSFLPFLLIII